MLGTLPLDPPMLWNHTFVTHIFTSHLEQKYGARFGLNFIVPKDAFCGGSDVFFI